MYFCKDCKLEFGKAQEYGKHRAILHRWSKEKKQEALGLLKELTSREVEELSGIPYQTLNRWAKREGVTLVKPKKKVKVEWKEQKWEGTVLVQVEGPAQENANSHGVAAPTPQEYVAAFITHLDNLRDQVVAKDVRIETLEKQLAEKSSAMTKLTNLMNNRIFQEKA